MKIRSTPRSWSQKKSSIYKSSKSSSSRTVGINIGSGIKLKDSIVPEISWTNIVIKVKKPKRDIISWKLTFKLLKYEIKLFTDKLKYGWFFKLELALIECTEKKLL